MRETIDQLKAQLARKESQISALEKELAKAGEEAAALRARAGQKTIPEQAAGQDAQLKAQLTELISQLNAARAEMASLKQINNTSVSGEQDRKLSDILAKRR